MPNRLALLCALLLLSMQPAWSSSSAVEAQLKAEYVGKTLTLRHFYRGGHLRFHSDGALIGDAEVGPWTLDGQLFVKEIRLHDDLVEIKGRRAEVVFDDTTKRPEAMPDSGTRKQDDETALRNYLANTHEQQAREEAETFLRERELDIEIELPSHEPSEQNISSAINRVFLAPGEPMLDIVPLVWRTYFAELEGTPGKAPAPEVPFSYAKPGNPMSPPKAISSPDPEYSPAAQMARYQGTILLALTIDTTGTPQDIQITKPLGLGLDDKAVAAVSTWKFEPARKESAPVAVRVVIEVTFHLY